MAWSQSLLIERYNWDLLISSVLNIAKSIWTVFICIYRLPGSTHVLFILQGIWIDVQLVWMDRPWFSGMVKKNPVFFMLIFVFSKNVIIFWNIITSKVSKCFFRKNIIFLYVEMFLQVLFEIWCDKVKYSYFCKKKKDHWPGFEKKNGRVCWAGPT